MNNTPRKLQARWSNDMQSEPFPAPTKWELLVHKWHSAIPTSCMCGEVHPIWKYVKKSFEFIFHKPNYGAIIEHEVVSNMSNSIRDEIDNDILEELRNLKDNKND